MASKKRGRGSKADKPSKTSAAKASSPPIAATPHQVSDGEVLPLEDGFIEIELSDDGDAADEQLKKSGRRQARVPVTEHVEVSGFFGVQGGQRVADVSVGGVFVETPHVLEVGDPVLLTFPDRAGKLRVSGRVRWVSPFGGVNDARAGMGIELVGVSDVERMRIFDLLRGKRDR